jgi:ATP-dependent Clp protease ATP-binding subunit ClpA
VFEQVSAPVKATIARSADEAARQGDRRIGTDHLLLGLLHEPDIAAAIGVDVERARTAAWNLDQAALAAIGIELGHVPPPSVPVSAGHASTTSGLRATMARAFALAKDEHSRKIEPRHLLQAILEREPPDAAAVLLKAIGVQPSP